jgi:hypothetical protein
MGKHGAIKLLFFDIKQGKAIFEAKVYTRKIQGPYRQASVTLPTAIAESFIDKIVKVTIEITEQAKQTENSGWNNGQH